MRATRLILALLAAATLPACTAYRTMSDPVAGLAAPKPARDARVTLRTGERFELEFPRVEGDSLSGFLFGGALRKVALADVARVEVQKVSAGRTAGLVLGLAVVGTAAAGAVSVGEFGTGHSTPVGTSAAARR